MTALVTAEYNPSEVIQLPDKTQPASDGSRRNAAFAELERGVFAALETYANVHRGSGHNSMVTTLLYEQAREIVLEHLGMKADKQVIFCSPWRAALLGAQLERGSYQSLSSQDIGLPLGVRALVVDRRALPGGVPLQPGGGTARLVSSRWVMWAKAPDRFEAGTPAIVNVIAFARALRLVGNFGSDAFRAPDTGMPGDEKQLATEILHRDELENYSGRKLLEELRKTLIGRDVFVPTVAGASSFINLDNAASTPTFAPIWETVRRVWRQPAPVQREIVGQVKVICAGMLGAPEGAYDVIFTSNTTEAVNLVAGSLGNAAEPGIQPVVLNTILEHNSNELPWRAVQGVSLIRLPVDVEGFMDLHELETLLAAYNREGQHGNQRIKLVAVSGASNVLGTFNDLADISRIVHAYGARLLVDAAQLVAHRKIDMAGWAIDFLAFSAHKAYAPFGAGVLVARQGLLGLSPDELAQLRSAGEENAAGIAALGKALLLLQRIGLDVIQEEERALTSRALRGMAQVPGIKIYGVKDPDSPRYARKGGVIAFDLGNILPSRVARELAERRGIGVRSGCHCAHLLVKRVVGIPPFLEQLQGLIVLLFPRLSLPGVVRVSLGIENTEAEVDALIEALRDIARQPKGEAGHGAQKEMAEFARAAAGRVYGSRAG
ncbi:MAG: aminotransferase class V-fold PLP-dependent enzyme [Nitrososphaerales archaeon]